MRLAGGKLGLGPLQFRDVAVDLEDGLDLPAFGRLRDPKAGNRDQRAVFPAVFNSPCQLPLFRTCLRISPRGSG
jgi:hypothetical protein